MMSSVLRRSSSIASSSARLALAAIASSESILSPSLLIPSYSSSFFEARPVYGAVAAGKVGFCGVPQRREFHFEARPLGFRDTEVARAEFAIDEDYYQGKGDDGLEIAKLGIEQKIVAKLANKGITKLFPIQKAVLEPAMQGRDMIGRARTGTGKTLAFGIPIMDNILRFQAKNGCGRFPLAIVLAPTRELARQVEKEFHESSPLETLCVYGGTPINQQMRALNYGVDVVVGTPGRVIDLLTRGALILSEIQFVVLDEADQMLNVGFAEDVEKILEKLPQNRQSMMFSATMPNWIRQLTKKYLNNPVIIDLVGDSDQKLAEGITIYSIATENYAKPSILGPLIKEHAKGGKCIVFTQTKRDADRLAYSMGRSYGCEALHGDISQNQRERTLADFRNGRFNILIATDVAARGLDIPNVDLVIHFELPNTSELFVHRSGRTGRAGKKGSAILIHTHDQKRLVRGIEQDTGCKFIELPTIKVEGGGDDMFGSMPTGSFGGGRSFGRGGSFGGSSYDRSRGFGESGSGRFGSFGGAASRRSSGFGLSSSTGNFGNHGDSGSGRFGSFGDSRSGRFGSSGDSRPGRFGSFGNSGSSGFSNFGNTSSNPSDSFSRSGQSTSSGDSGSGRGGLGDWGSGRFGSFGKSSSSDSSNFGNTNSNPGSGYGQSNFSGFGRASGNNVDDL